MLNSKASGRGVVGPGQNYNIVIYHAVERQNRDILDPATGPTDLSGFW